MAWRDNPDIKKLYVGGLKEETTEENIREHFQQYGEITELNLVRTPEGKSKGFCFVSFSDSDSVDNILFNFESHSLDGKKIEVKRAIPRGDTNPLAHVRTKKLFVGGLKNEQTEEDIKTALAEMVPFPPESIKLMKDKMTNKFKGYAFVNFNNEHIVDKLYIIRKAEVAGLPVELKKAEEFGGGAGGERGGRGGRGGMRGGGRGGFGGRGGRGGGRGGRGGGGYGGDDYSGAGYDGGWGYEGYGGDGYGSYGGDYGGYGDYSGYGGGYGGGYDYSTQEPSGYGPSRGRGGRGRGGGGGYRPY